MLHLLCTIAAALLQPSAIPADGIQSRATERVALSAALVALLPSEGAPAFATGDLLSAIESLEALEYGPETAEFHRIGVTGHWALRSASEPTHASPLEAFEMRTADIDILSVEQTIDGDGSLRTAVQFHLPADALDGRLEIDGTLALTPMVDSLDLRTSGRRLSLKQAPSTIGIPDLMKALHARLGPESRGEEGVRIGLQTTYMDESLRITRCTTGSLRGDCTVHVRVKA